MNSKSADGVSGHLLYLMTGKYVFRVYERKRNNIAFTDYDIAHCDLFVKITDIDAYFYTTDDGQHILDHSPKTLGLING